MKKLDEAVEQISFNELKGIKDLSMVVLGAGGDPQEWVDGISDVLRKESIVALRPDTFSRAAIITGNKLGDEGRKDLLLVFNPEAKPNVSRLAMWRIQWGGISWLEDFIHNYAKDYAPARSYETKSQSSVNRLLS